MGGRRIRCSVCGGVFEHEAGIPAICPDCVIREEEECRRVREYVRDNRGASAAQAAAATGVERSRIMRYLANGRLESL
ncbi:MAG: hypothetical protein LBU36_01590 [Clostridiales bacterium]|jgi:hypothetical protein|nr:hypothetical protein [Clostridiales bacterium]